MITEITDAKNAAQYNAYVRRFFVVLFFVTHLGVKVISLQ